MTISTPSAELLIDHMFLIELQQGNHISNNMESKLDLIFIGDSEFLDIKSSDMLVTRLEYYHPSIELSCEYLSHPDSRSKEKIQSIHFSKATYAGILLRDKLVIFQSSY